MERGVQTGAHIGQEERRTCMAAIEVRHLYKRFEQKGVTVEALSDINLTVEQGDIYGIIGMSGAGKSTLVRCINLLERPTEGQVYLDGQELTCLSEKDLRQARRSMGMIFQQFHLLMQRTAMENVCFPMEIAGVKKAEAREKAKELLELVGLGDRMESYPSQLSGGQKQRVALARTMVMKPKILLLDEPLSALDGVIKESIKEKIKQIARDYHLTTIIVTHDPEEALTLSDKVLIVNDGSISQYGAPEEIITTPQNAFIKEFILNQLEIKRNNIFALFHQEIMAQAV